MSECVSHLHRYGTVACPCNLSSTLESDSDQLAYLKRSNLSISSSVAYHGLRGLRFRCPPTCIQSSCLAYMERKKESKKKRKKEKREKKERREVSEGEKEEEKERSR